MMSTGLEGVGRSFLHLPGLLVHFDPCWGEQDAETLGLRPHGVGEGGGGTEGGCAASGGDEGTWERPSPPSQREGLAP